MPRFFANRAAELKCNRGQPTNITEALSILRVRKAAGEPFSVLLACGFTPLHLKTLLHAHLHQERPQNQNRQAP